MTLPEALRWLAARRAEVHFRAAEPGSPVWFFRRPWVWASCEGCNPATGRTLLAAARKLRRHWAAEGR